MCLKAIFDKKKAKKIKAFMPEILTVYKVALVSGPVNPMLRRIITNYVAPGCKTDYGSGLQFTRPNLGSFAVTIVDCPDRCDYYYPGFHSFVRRSGANEYQLKISPSSKDPTVVLTCGIRKEWIIAIGIEGNRELVVVSNRIVLPAYPETDISSDSCCQWFFIDQSQEQSLAAQQSPETINRTGQNLTIN